ncbi:MAG: glycosyltransferase family 4 protein [Bacteroidales bacterium]
MLKKKKVCFFSAEAYSFFSKNNSIIHGGAELQIYLLSTFLARYSNFEVSVIVGNYGQKKIEIHNNVNVYKGFNLPIAENLFHKLIKAIQLFTLLIRINPQLVFTTGASALPGVVSLYKSVFRKKHIHRTASLQDVDNSWIKQNNITGFIYSYGLKNADLALVQNNYHKTLLFQNNKKGAEVLRNVLHIENQKIEEKNYILWIGRFDPIKKPEIFIQLCRDLPMYQFKMVCPYDKHYTKGWQELKSKAEKLSNLTLIEKIPFHEIQKIFNEALLFVNTSYSEGFPNTFLQSALAQTPVVSLNVNPDGFIDTFDSGVFCHGDYSQMIEAVRFLMENQEERTKKGLNFYNYLAENHDIEKVGPQLVNFIHRLLK